MAISQIGSNATSAIAGTTILVPGGTVTFNVTAGDMIVLAAAQDPNSGTLTFTKASGTATISTFASQVSQVGSVAKETVTWCDVTATGTLQLQVSSTATYVSGTLRYVQLRGVSGIGQTGKGTGTTGTDLTLTLTTGYANSWVVLTGCEEATITALTAGVHMAASPRVSQANATGTVNDLSTGLGWNGIALAQGTVEDIHFTKVTGLQYAAIALEVVQQFTKGGVGAGTGAGMLKVPTNLKAVADAATGVGSPAVATNLRAGTGHGATSFVVTPAENKTVTATGVGVPKVPTNLKAAAVAAAETSMRLTSSVRAATGAATETSTRLASSVHAGVGAAAAAGVAKVLTNFKSITVHAADSAVEIPFSPVPIAVTEVAGTGTHVLIASSVKARTVTAAGVGTKVASSPRVAAGAAAATEVVKASSAKGTTTFAVGLGIPAVATNLKAVMGTAAGTSARVASSLRAGIGVAGATSAVKASSVRAGIGNAFGVGAAHPTGAIVTARAQSTAVFLANSVKSVGHTATALATAKASSVKSVPGTAASVSAVRAATGAKGGLGGGTSTSNMKASSVRAGAGHGTTSHGLQVLTFPVLRTLSARATVSLVVHNPPVPDETFVIPTRQSQFASGGRDMMASAADRSGTFTAEGR